MSRQTPVRHVRPAGGRQRIPIIALLVALAAVPMVIAVLAGSASLDGSGQPRKPFVGASPNGPVTIGPAPDDGSAPAPGGNLAQTSRSFRGTPPGRKSPPPESTAAPNPGTTAGTVVVPESTCTGTAPPVHSHGSHRRRRTGAGGSPHPDSPTDAGDPTGSTGGGPMGASSPTGWAGGGCRSMGAGGSTGGGPMGASSPTGWAGGGCRSMGAGDTTGLTGGGGRSMGAGGSTGSTGGGGPMAAGTRPPRRTVSPLQPGLQRRRHQRNRRPPGAG